MAELKTRVTTASVAAFLGAIEDDERRADCKKVAALMKKVTGAPPRMWGTSIVGFGTYHYRYASGQEADWPLAAFSPRKGDLTLYILPGFTGYGGLMKKLGKYKTGKVCLYLKRLADVDLKVLEQLIRGSVRHTKKLFP